MDFKNPEHLAEVIDGVLEFSRQHSTPASYRALVRRVISNAGSRMDEAVLTRRWLKLATGGLITASRQARIRRARQD